MKISNLLEYKRLPGQFGAQVMTPQEFVKADEKGIDVDPNKIDQEHEQEQEVNVNENEDNLHHRINRLEQMITDYHRRAKISKSDIRKNHYLQMADQYTSELQNLIDYANEMERDGNMIARHDATPSDLWNKGGLTEGIFDMFKKKPVEKDDPHMMPAFNAAGGYKRGLDVEAWQMGWKFSKKFPNEDVSKVFQELYYGGGSPFAFDEKTFKLAWDAAKEDQGMNEGTATNSLINVTSATGKLKGREAFVRIGDPRIPLSNKTKFKRGIIFDRENVYGIVPGTGSGHTYWLRDESGKEFRAPSRDVFVAKEQNMAEATKLPAPQKEFGDQDFQDYMTRIQGVPDIDKKTGQPKMTKARTTKTGIYHPPEPKFVSGKTKADKFKMPYVHRSSVITYYDASGKRFREDQVINALKERPKKLLKQNEKMKHSNGALEQFFNIGFAALTGIAVDESTGKLIIVNTCPGAGSCKVDCFAMKGGKVQFKNAWLSDGRILTFLLNDPDGFFSKLDKEIKHESKLGEKGFKEKGQVHQYSVTIRWHDAGDFFSPEYLDLAFKLAKANPNVKFYAYTKVADAALAQKPDNFIINWSEGAHTSQEKQVKQDDPNLEKTKNSRIVPEKLFYDLLKKDAKGNLDKEGADEEGKGGRWVMRDSAATKELKQRLGDYYNISPSSILTYDEYTSKSKVKGMKYNVIVAPGEGDISANDPNVLSTLLLKH